MSFLKYLLIGLLTLSLAAWLIDRQLGRCKRSDSIAKAIENVSEANLREHVVSLAAIGSPFRRVEKGSGLKASPGPAADISQINRNLKPHGLELVSAQAREQKLSYIETVLKNLGIEAVRQNFETEKIGTGTNLIATFPGKSSSPILDVTAHYDTYADSPGADDNSSGVAGVLEVARLLAIGKTPAKAVRFVFFDMEELGLIGSGYYTNKILSGEVEKPELCLNFEMIGYFTDAPDSQKSPARIPILFEPPTVGNSIVTVGNFDTYKYGRKLDGTFQTYTSSLPLFSVSRWGDLIGNASRSDHSSYWKAGIPALMLTDTANFRNPHYHKKTDTPQTLDFERMKQVVQGAAAFVLDWASN